MPWNALLLALVGGFLYYRTFNGTRFIASRSDGQRLLLESSLYGTFLLGGGYVLCRLIIAFLPAVYKWWPAHILYYPRIGPPLLALVLGLAIPRVLNFFLREENVKETSFKRFSDFFGLLMYQAQCEDRQVAIDLKNHKVYIGLCIEFIPPGEHDKGGSILLQPVASGYRDPSTHALKLTTEYSLVTRSVIAKTDEAERCLSSLSDAYRQLSRYLKRSEGAILKTEMDKALNRLEEAQRAEDMKLRDLQIALLSSEIVTVRFFDEGIFKDFAS